MSSTDLATRKKQSLDSPVPIPSASPTRLNGKKIDDKRFSTFSSLKAMSGRGAYIDESGVRWDTNAAEYEGFLNKKSRWIGEWRKRYFILKGTKLFFAKTAMIQPHGMIDLADCVAIRSAEASTKKRNALEIMLKKDHIVLIAPTERDKDEWIGHIGRAMVRNSGMFVEETTNEEEEDDVSDFDDDDDDQEEH